MSIEYIAKCTYCDFSVDYRPDDYNYHYPGLSSHPKISHAWCGDCNKFVPVQSGINIEKLYSLQNKLYQELISLEKQFIKSERIKTKIELTKEQLKETIALVALVDNHSTQATCIECGGNNLVYKDIEHQIWRCPKCRIGLLKLQQEEDDVLYRKCDKIIFPQLTNINYGLSTLVPKIVLCSIDLINNEGVYYRLSKNPNAISSLTKNTSLIDRICLVYAVLVQMFNIDIPLKNFVMDVVDDLISSNIITDDVKDLTVYRFDERIKFFNTEIKVEQNCKAFMPSAIIKTLRNPQAPPTHNIIGIDVLDLMQHWKVIIDTIQAYFEQK